MPPPDLRLRSTEREDQSSLAKTTETPSRHDAVREPEKEHGLSLKKTGLLFSLSYLAVAVAWAVLRRSGDNSPLSESYALCSKRGAMIYTVDEKDSRVQCLVVSDTKIVDRGTLAEVKFRWQNPVSTRVSDRNGDLVFRFIEPGSIVVPGLSDSHAHILEYGASRLMPLGTARSPEEAAELVKNFVIADPEVYNDTTKFVEGWGWDHTIWANGEWPTSAVFEAIPTLRGRPIVLRSKDGHALWVSSAVLQLMDTLPDVVDGGVIVRDTGGSATGVFVDNAQDLVVCPPLSDQALLRRFQATVDDAHAQGLTSIHDAGLTSISLEFFTRQSKRASLPIRIYGMKYFEENDYWGNNSQKIHNEGRLTARSVKIFADGALRTGGAALHEPYSDHPETRGVMRVEPELLQSVIPRFFRDGWQVNVHSIGDRANAIVLDAFESALAGANVSALRPRLEHAQIMAEADMARLAKLGVIASIQPAHATSDMWYAEDRLGPDRVKGLYAFRSIIDNGARVTFGSDFPVEELAPLFGFYAAITRLSPDGFPEQRLTRQEALRGMTIEPAYASFSESWLGSLEVGKQADYVVLSQDIMAVPDDQILATEVQATAIDGEVVFGQL